jgi:hypothetical protein
MSEDEIVKWVHLHLRKWVHDSNNALFIAKGFLEETMDELGERKAIQNDEENQKMLDSLAAVNRAMVRLEDQVGKLRAFAKEEIFEHTGVAKPLG